MVFFKKVNVLAAGVVFVYVRFELIDRVVKLSRWCRVTEKD